MILTILTLVALAAVVVGLAVILIRAFAAREKAYTKVTVPPAYYPPAPQMVGLSQTIEQAAADQAAKKLCEEIEYDLFRGSPGVDDYATPPAPPKRKRAPKGMRKTEIPGVYVAKESTSIFAPPKSSKKRKPSKKRTKR